MNAAFLEEDVPGITGWQFTHMAGLLLRHGRLFTPAPLPGDVELGEAGTCWPTSQDRADVHGLVYVEGFASSGLTQGLDTEHGWCVRPGGHHAVDPTWPVPGAAYLGVPFTAEFRADALARLAGHRRLLGPHPEFGRALLADGLPDGAVHEGVGRPLPDTARLP